MKKLTLPIALTMVVLATIGYAYELSYFATLKMNVHEILGFEHIIFSGLTTLLPMLMVALAFSLIAKFFSKDIEKNDLEEIDRVAKNLNFTKTVSTARITFICCFGYWLLVLSGFNIGEGNRFGNLYMFVTFLALQGYFFALYLSPPHSRPTIFFAFLISLFLCISAGAIDRARITPSGVGIVRDDAIVKIQRTKDGLIAEAKNVQFPASMIVGWFSTKYGN